MYLVCLKKTKIETKTFKREGNRVPIVYHGYYQTFSICSLNKSTQPNSLGDISLRSTDFWPEECHLIQDFMKQTMAKYLLKLTIR